MTAEFPRRTRQQAAVSRALELSPEFRSAQQLHDSLRADGTSIGLATVYRNLQGLVEAGVVDTIRSGDGEQLYRRCETTEHHHHLICTSCGKTVEITGDGVENWLASLATEHGFSRLEHDLEMTGVCADCAAASGSSG